MARPRRAPVYRKTREEMARVSSAPLVARTASSLEEIGVETGIQAAAVEYPTAECGLQAGVAASSGHVSGFFKWRQRTPTRTCPRWQEDSFSR